jgi:hypothetical protein
MANYIIRTNRQIHLCNNTHKTQTQLSNNAMQCHSDKHSRVKMKKMLHYCVQYTFTSGKEVCQIKRNTNANVNLIKSNSCFSKYDVSTDKIYSHCTFCRQFLYGKPEHSEVCKIKNGNYMM